jgi:hypothetical protein
VNALVAGPAGYLSVIAVMALLITRAFLRERRPRAFRRLYSVGSVLTYCAGLVAFAILTLRFIGFS